MWINDIKAREESAAENKAELNDLLITAVVWLLVGRICSHDISHMHRIVWTELISETQRPEVKVPLSLTKCNWILFPSRGFLSIWSVSCKHYNHILTILRRKCDLWCNWWQYPTAWALLADATLVHVGAAVLNLTLKYKQNREIRCHAQVFHLVWEHWSTCQGSGAPSHIYFLFRL